MIYIHWIFSLVIISNFVFGVDYSELEEANGLDKSPKFRLIFNLRTKLLFAMSVIYLILCIAVR
ncbi:hypothetical protein C9J27_03405 [Photobacterium kishitanii]|uniref:Uncharacterized protein n=1 Tax=Photobacterium kishitanii TaxID=318456 RepID=A0A2T3KMS0_9GAMM|nr:hypothetical protein C9J27_03405 [Photobacterium kishitanii]